MSDQSATWGSASSSFLDRVCEGPRRTVAAELPHVSIEREAARAPDAIAVVYRGERLTYGELNRRANRLARFLRSRGLGAESRVAVSILPTLDVAVVLLGILKAGATYVPVDPAYPILHVQDLVADVDPVLIIGDATSTAFDGRAVFSVAEAEAAARDLPAENPEFGIDRESSAYVFYTSGTTGKQKGVLASYANLASYVTAARERYGFSPNDVMPAIARFSFSISLFELLTPLSAGGTLLVLDRDHVRSPERLAATLADVTIFHAGPSLLRPVLDAIRARGNGFEAFAKVRHASSGGDMIAPEVLESAKEIFYDAEVFVIYGCSEIACMGCTYEVPRDRRITKTFVGRPFDGMSVRVVNEALERALPGEVGEICFCGSGVVKGYLNRPDLTASRFVDIEGRRFYRTGDVGRITRDGFLEILGRSDFQAKIRGMRVELGEVEYHLRRAPNVKDAVVMPRDGADGEKILVAYVVPNDQASPFDAPRAALLRKHMVEHVPDYMVPAIYFELAELPLNHNLKVDRRALPAPVLPQARPDRQPESRTEKELLRLWKNLLPVGDVGLDDNFFELGGSSLLAVRFIDDVERELGVLLDGMDVLRESLEVLARRCDERLGRAADAPRPPARSSGVFRSERFHFGPREALYGVLARPDRARSETAVLVCAPVGQEAVRADFVVRALVKRMSARGVAMMRFDYFGTGDSLGEGASATCSGWQRDIEEAHQELVRRTGARRVVAVGIRLGATLLWNAARNLKLDGLVLWDPVVRGADYVARLEDAHRRCLDANEHFSFWKRRVPKTTGTELLGSTYSAAALAELRALSVLGPRPSGRVRWLLSDSKARAAHAIESLGLAGISEVTTLDDACFWDDPSRLEDVLPDTGLSSALGRAIGELA